MNESQLALKPPFPTKAESLTHAVTSRFRLNIIEQSTCEQGKGSQTAFGSPSPTDELCGSGREIGFLGASVFFSGVTGLMIPTSLGCVCLCFLGWERFYFIFTKYCEMAYNRKGYQSDEHEQNQSYLTSQTGKATKDFENLHSRMLEVDDRFKTYCHCFLAIYK